MGEVSRNYYIRCLENISVTWHRLSLSSFYNSEDVSNFHISVFVITTSFMNPKLSYDACPGRNIFAKEPWRIVTLITPTFLFNFILFLNFTKLYSFCQISKLPQLLKDDYQIIKISYNLVSITKKIFSLFIKVVLSFIFVLALFFKSLI